MQGVYDKSPTIALEERPVWSGMDEIAGRLSEAIGEQRTSDDSLTVVCEAYPGVDDDALLELFSGLGADTLIDTRDLFPSEDELTARMRPFLTEDRVFGRMCYGTISDFMDGDALGRARAIVADATGLTVVCGFGASLVAKGDMTCQVDITRWEIQLRYRDGMPNYHCLNGSEDPLRKIKRGYFVEWRLADKLKSALLGSVDWYIDATRRDQWSMVEGGTLRYALDEAACRPFRTVPYFDPGVWGGQWMRRVCGLDADAANYAWSFDGVPEENEICFDFGGSLLHVPAMNLTLAKPLELLGEEVFARFGAEFPIRFDFLDTMGGQNLSLQVHPTSEYIHRQFGMAYTQDESYYILDAGDDACVYLGLREGIDPGEMVDALRRANSGGEPFDAERYVNVFPAHQHDHFLIPAGTVHCSGRNAMVLEISATPYIFTFKLWDWGRVGLDGRPRPVHIDHGSRVIRWGRTTSWVRENLVNRATPVDEPCGADLVESTGLHELEFIETRRYTMTGPSRHNTEGTLNVLNLVSGKGALITSPGNEFPPFKIHYAETFIVPASVGPYVIEPEVQGEEVMVIKAYVRHMDA
ncbi:mannose-6-phosphate isomerase [Olsenella sp. SW781]|nr:mannose-6-phosphate isomerase [Olsenella sp. SW781]